MPFVLVSTVFYIWNSPINLHGKDNYFLLLKKEKYFVFFYLHILAGNIFLPLLQ